MARVVISLTVALVVAGCSSDSVAGNTTVPATTTTIATATIATTTTSTSTPPPTTAPRQTTTTMEIDVEIKDGVIIGPDRFEYARGETVSIAVVADIADQIHVHGYDFFYDLEPESPLQIEFVAEVAGIFEVELEGDHQQLFEIEVGG